MQSFSLLQESKSHKNRMEQVMRMIFIVCGLFSIAMVFVISIYMFVSGTPAMFKVGFREFFLGTEWAPTAPDPKYGILPMVLTSIIGTGLTILIGVPIAILTAVYIVEMANKKVASFIRYAVELLAGIPSVVYGLIGMMVLVPQISKLEKLVFLDSSTHIFTGGANLLSGVIVLAIMILPTVVNTSITALKAVPNAYMASSLALGSSRIQSIFKVMIPSARSGITSGVVLGIGRALGEAMAVILVSGNAVNMPAIFNSVRFLTTGIVSEMSYASGLHREALFSIGLILFIFIMVINIVLNRIIKKEERKSNG